MPVKITPWIKTMIADNLRRKEPSLKLYQFDSRILRICCIDFNNYIMWMREEKIKPQVELELSANERDERTAEFIPIWVGMWWAKWLERVKITLKLPELPKSTRKNIKKGKTQMSQFTTKERISFVNEMIKTLIKNGEICCGQIMADIIFSRILGRFPFRLKWSLEEKINLLNSLKRESARIAYFSGPLIFIKPDKGYYKLAEFRGDNSPTQGL